VLTGGPGSQDAAALPGRLHWQLGLGSQGLAMRLQQACCLQGPLTVLVAPRWGGVKLSLPDASTGAAGAAPAAAQVLGQWPAAWLAGLGTPFNTLQLGGWFSLSSQALVLESGPGGWQMQGQAALSLFEVSSRVSTLPVLGSWRLGITAGQSGQGGQSGQSGTSPQLRLSTERGPLQLQGQGEWAANGRLRFRGDARAEPGTEAALNNLLNIIGRRQGKLAVITIG
jgi:general secretion pathway protein N